MDELKFESSAVHIALATYPIGKEQEFHEHIDSIYSDFREKQKTLNPDGVHLSNVYFNPYRYHMFGHYNVGYISLIDNYKFAQRVFTSTSFPKNTFSYQIQTGSLLDTLPYGMLILKGLQSYFSNLPFPPQLGHVRTALIKDVERLIQQGIDSFISELSSAGENLTGSLIDNLTVFDLIRKAKPSFLAQSDIQIPLPPGSPLETYKLTKWISDGINAFYSEKPYLQITNLKLSNGLLIGAGADFKNLVISKIRKLLMPKIEDCVHILLNSFNWSDLTLILISGKPSLPFDIIYELRNLSFKDLFDNKEAALHSEVLKNTLYRSVFEFKEDEILNAHVFVDTHSYYGFSLEIFEEKNSSSAFLYDEFKTIIEIEEKPGHLSSFVDSLVHDGLISDSIRNKIGKTDYLLQKSVKGKDASPFHDNLKSNYNLFHHIEQGKLYRHIRRIKTTPTFPLTSAHKGVPVDESVICDVTLELKKLIQKDEEVINRALKKLNLSRQLRTKIRKVFHSYKIGISDSILFIYFIDFIPFINFLKEFIERKSDTLEKLIHDGEYPVLKNIDGLDVNRIESVFDAILKAFEEAYDDRILNNYQFEDINDYSIDFNTSITQIISTTDSLIKMISPSLFEPDGKLLIRQNELNTVSNVISINYNVFHLLEPSFMVNTIVKEILNNYNFHIDIGQHEAYASIINRSKIEIVAEYNEMLRLRSEPADEIMNDFKLIYYEIDLIKYFYTFNGNTELYVFWSWVHFLQHTGVYSSLGYIVERPFVNELIRIMLVVAVFDESYFNDDRLECPIPELFSYWEKNYLNMKQRVKNVLRLQKFQELTKTLVNLYANETTSYLVNLEPGLRTNGLLTKMELLHLSEMVSTQKLDPDKLKIIDDKFANRIISDKLSNYLEKGNGNRSKLDNISLSMEMFNYYFSSKLEQGESLIFNKEFVDKSPASGTADEEMMVLFFNCLSYTILTWYYEKMKHELHLLRRDYQTGEIMMEFVNEYPDIFLFIDPNGDFFTPNESARLEIMKFKHAVFYSLWHLGVVYKKQIFKKEFDKQTKK